MANTFKIRVGDLIVIDPTKGSDGRFAPGKRYVVLIAPTGERPYLGLGYDGGRMTDPAVTWIAANSDAIVEHRPK